jgi:hypothetical protein
MIYGNLLILNRCFRETKFYYRPEDHAPTTKSKAGMKKTPAYDFKKRINLLIKPLLSIARYY